VGDIYNEVERSKLMSKISGKETKPEVTVRKYLYSKGFRYFKNVNSLPGKPDIVLQKYLVVLFINGCFWHGHNCKYGKLPETNRTFWEGKIMQTIERDHRNMNELQNLGWKVIIVWECELRNETIRSTRLIKLENQILSSSNLDRILWI
jgi:DNA mismatch endonuclease, patch repair protein